MALTYNPDIFSVQNLAQAKSIILTAESGTTDERWEQETPLFCDLLAAHNTIEPGALVLDYGCGIGRMAKELIARHRCRVIGVDISPSMRALSVQYVNSDDFFSCSPAMFAMLLNQGLRFDFAISIWVLQHCLTPASDIGFLKQALKKGGGLFIANNLYRAVPTKEAGWANDGVDIRKELAETFSMHANEVLQEPAVPATLAGITFWATFTNDR